MAEKRKPYRPPINVREHGARDTYVHEDILNDPDDAEVLRTFGQRAGEASDADDRG